MTTVNSGGFDNLIVISVFFLIIKCGEGELKYLVTLTVF